MLVIAERFPEREDVMREVGLLDEGPGPHPLHQLVLVDDAPRVLDEHEQHVEILGPERDELTMPQQDTLAAVEAERTEAVYLAAGVRHTDGPICTPPRLAMQRARSSL